jgi:hypothetical protein
MSRVDYADPQAPAPSFGVPEPLDPTGSQPRATRAVRFAIVPLAISLGAHFVFFLAFWVPETNRFPPQEWWLNQLAPLSSRYLISGGEPLADLQENSAGIPAALLLILSLLILWMARSGYWVARTWIWAPVLAGAAVCVVTIALLAAQNSLGLAWVSVLLMICWVGAAGAAAWLSMVVDVDSLPAKSHTSGLSILIAYVLLGAPPTAVGRLLFAPELREVAADLQQNSVALRTAALGLPTNLWIYLTGVLAGVVAWLAYQLIPPRRDRRTVTLAGVLVGSLIVLLVLGAFVTRPAALEQTERLRTESPADRLRINCGEWIVDPAAPVKQTVVISGSGCQTVTTYEGYVQLDVREIPESLRGVSVRTPEGVRITSQLVAARYDSMLVVATRDVDDPDSRATSVRGLLLTDGIPVWQWSCPNPTDLTLRFAGVPSGDDEERGYITLPGEPPGVVVGCPAILKHLDPQTGLGKR